jgi:hypothetical protein
MTDQRPSLEWRGFASWTRPDTSLKRRACHQGGLDLRGGASADDEELGLDRFTDELHWDALTIAYAFLQFRRLGQSVETRKEKIQGLPPQPTLPAIRVAAKAALERPTSTMSAKAVLAPLVEIPARETAREDYQATLAGQRKRIETQNEGRAKNLSRIRLRSMQDRP